MKTSRNMNNLEMAEALRAVAAAYKIKSEPKNRFRIIAYERAADAVEHLSSEAKDLWDEGKLEGVSGIGEAIAGYLDEIFKTGKSKHFDQVLGDIPPAVFELIKIPGVGPKNASKLVDAFDINEAKGAVEKLKKVASQGEIAKLPGFGEDSQNSILIAIGEYKGRKNDRMLLSRAEEISKLVTDWLYEDKNTVQADSLGSQRRKASTVGDIDLAVSSKDPAKTIEHFGKYPNKSRVLESGTRTASIILPGNVQVDLMVERQEAYGALLQHFTGSKQHNIALRELAVKKGWSLSDYGIKIGGKLEKIEDEEEVYGILGLEYIPPELREGSGEIEAARKKTGSPGGLPVLVEQKQIKGDLQMHSDFDIETSHDIGDSSMEDMINEANSLGYEYIAFTEHNPAQKGHNAKQINEILKKKREKIEQLNDSLKMSKKNSVKKVFNSLEIDILPDGRLPVDTEGLEILDFALVSIHSSFRLDRKKMTKRVLSALAMPNVKIFAHPTARKLREREGVELDWDMIFDFCVKQGRWIEINAEPSRLDLPDFLVREAVEKGVGLTLGTDAHNRQGLNNMKYGVNVARRGWATANDIVNTKTLEEFERALRE